MTAPDLLGGFVPTPRRRASNLLVAVTAAASVAVAGAGVAAAAALGGGGGVQPADVLPSSAVAAVTIDLDPAADQKLAAYRLSKKFPALKVSGEDSVLVDLLRQAVESSQEVDYGRDVEPWLGKRLGVAAVPTGAGVEPVIAVQVTDRAEAQRGLEKLVADAPGDLTYAFVDDYALLATEAAKYAAAEQHLSDNEAYGDAIDELEGNQIVSAWVDFAGAYAAAPKAMRAPAQKPSGTLVAGLHLDGSYAEITGKALGVTTGEESPVGRGEVGLLQKLPDDTVAAVGVRGLDDGLRSALDAEDGTFRRLLEGFEGNLGASLSEDLPAALGTETVLAVLGQGGQPAFAGRSRTPEADRGVAALQQMLAQSFFRSSPDPLARATELVRRTSDGLAAASDPATLARVMADGDLGDSEQFRDAVPDADGAGMIAYVDVQRALALSGQELDGDEARNVEDLRAVGMSMRTRDGGNGEFRLRVTFR